MKYTRICGIRSFRPGLGLLGLVFLAALLSACASAPKKVILTVNIQASEDVNPDLQGRPSPIILHVMELKSAEMFNSLDYMGLADASGGALGVDLVGRSQMVLSPGGSRQLPMELDAATTHVGFVAGYRNMDNATWRQAVPVSPSTTLSITVNLGQAQLTASAQ